MSTWTEKSQAIPVIQAGVSDRMAFIKKVYSLLGLSLLTGILASVFTLSNVGFLDTVNQNYWFFVIAEIGVLLLCFWKRKTATLGFVLLFTFTILSGITVSPLIYVYKAVAGQAALLTVVAFCGLTAYVFVGKIPISKWFGYNQSLSLRSFCFFRTTFYLWSSCTRKIWRRFSQ